MKTIFNTYRNKIHPIGSVALSVIGISSLLSDAVEWVGFYANLIDNYQNVSRYLFSFLPFNVPNLFIDASIIYTSLFAGSVIKLQEYRKTMRSSWLSLARRRREMNLRREEWYPNRSFKKYKATINAKLIILFIRNAIFRVFVALLFPIIIMFGCLHSIYTVFLESFDWSGSSHHRFYQLSLVFKSLLEIVIYAGAALSVALLVFAKNLPTL